MQQKIRELLNKETWEIKTLGEIATDMYSGNEITQEQLNTGTFPAVKCGDINSKLKSQFRECVSFVNPDLITKPKYFKNGDILISALGSMESIGRAVIYLGEDECLAGNDVIVFKSNNNMKYLLYAISSSFCQKQIKKCTTPAMVCHLYIKNLKQIQIPIPPRHIQDLIADHLDKFTELEKELEGRKKQYKRYKEMIFNDEVNRWGIVPLSKIAKDICSGNEVTKAQLGTGNYPSIKVGDVHNNYFLEIKKCSKCVNPNLIKNKRYCEYEDLLISQMSNDVKKTGRAVVYLGETKALLGQHIYAIKHHQNSKFLAYVFSSKYMRKQIEAILIKGTVVELRKSSLPNIQVPLPSLEEQEEIVSILDKFRKITEDFEEGIPKLLDLVRQEYKYWKEEMLKI